MTQRFTNPLSKFTTDTLQSLPYATLSFYVSGSSTTKAVYADKARVTSLGTIVTADSAGIFPPIWLDGTYRATLRSRSSIITDSPATGTVQTGWPIDNVGDNQNFTAFSAWDATFTYDITTNTFVTGSDGNYYQSLQNPNFNKDPISNADYWQRIYFLPNWNANVNYAANILVVYNGLLYKSNTTPNLNHAPPNLSYWDNVSFNASITGPFTATGTITGNALVSTTSVTAATVTASGAITAGSFGDVSATTVTATSGVAVGNSAQAGATILDWYEEGTFTPVIIGLGTAGTATYSVQTGVFTRIGNTVNLSINLVWSSHTGTGQMRITGLPYSAASTASSPASLFYSAISTIRAGAHMQTMVSGGTTYMSLEDIIDSGSIASVSVSAAGTLRISCRYLV